MAMAQKVYTRRRPKIEEIHQIDHIPDHRKQRRSPSSKRKRTHFSLFSSSSEYFGDSFSTLSTDSDDNKGGGNEFSELLPPSSEERLRHLSDVYGVPVAEGESIGKNGINCSNSQKESEVAVSESENCSESCNFMEDLQDAAKHVPKGEEVVGSPGKLPQIPDGSNHSDQQDQSSDKNASLVSSMKEADFKPRRVNRDRRPNIRFGEVTFQQNPARHVRRFRIMRHLGLIAPVGSPF